MSKQKIQLSDHFDYSRLLRFVLPLRRHHAVHLHLRHRGRPVRLELCGQNGFCSGQPYHARADAGRLGGLHAWHRRQRHRGHHAGRGRPGKGRPLFQPLRLDGPPRGHRSLRCWRSHRPPGGGAAGRRGRDAGLCRPLWPPPDAVPALLHFAEYVPELLRHRRKAPSGLRLHGGGGRHQHGIGRRAGGYAPRRRGGRSHRHLHQPGRGRRAASVLLS